MIQYKYDKVLCKGEKEMITKKDKIIELRKQSLGYGMIAKEIGCNIDYVKEICRKNGMGGVKAPKPVGISKQPKPKVNKECKGCSKAFETRRDRQTFCSTKCRLEYKPKKEQIPLKPLIQKECKECKTSFEVKDNKAGNKRMFCSPSCATTFKNKSRKAASSKITKQKHIDFVEKVIDKYDGEIEVLSMYTGWDKPIKLRCNECGKIWWKTMARETLRAKCTCNSVSRGETIVTDYLLDKQIYFEREKSFDDLVYQKPLRYDFFLPEYNVLIEYDGKQHFKPIETFGGEEYLKETMLRDKLKNEYAKQKDMLLIRIKYDCNNIKAELGEKLKEII